LEELLDAWERRSVEQVIDRVDSEDVEARCLLVGSLWIGNHFMAADRGARSRADVLELAFKRLLA
jgi:hypothetical protein